MHNTHCYFACPLSLNVIPFIGRETTTGALGSFFLPLEAVTLNLILTFFVAIVFYD